MNTYKTITLEQAVNIPFIQLVNEYNETIEDIWYLQQQLSELRKENEQIWKAYEEVDMLLHG